MTQLKNKIELKTNKNIRFLNNSNNLTFRNSFLIFLAVVLLFNCGNIFAFDIGSFEYGENISFSIDSSDSNYSYNVSQLNITIKKVSGQEIYSFFDNETNYHNSDKFVKIENKYIDSLEVYNYTPGNYNVLIEEKDQFGNILTIEYIFGIQEPIVYSEDFEIKVLDEDSIVYDNEFKIKVTSKKNHPFKINDLYLLPSNMDFDSYKSIKSIANTSNNGLEYNTEYTFSFIYEGISSLVGNSILTDNKILEYFNEENLSFYVNLTPKYNENSILINKKEIKSNFSLELNIEKVNFNDYWNIIGNNNKDLIFNVSKNNDILGGKINYTNYNEETGASLEYSDNKFDDFFTNKKIEIISSYYDFNQKLFYYNYTGEFPLSNEMILTNQLLNNSLLIKINSSLFTSTVPIKEDKYKIVNKTGQGYITIPFKEEENKELKLIPKLYNDYYINNNFFKELIVFDNISPIINYTNIIDNKITISKEFENLNYIKITEKNIPKCDQMNFFYILIISNETNNELNKKTITCDDITQEGEFISFKYNFDKNLKYNFSIVVFDKAYNKVEKNYSNISIDEKLYNLEINNLKNLKSSPSFYLNNNYYLRENKSNIRVIFDDFDLVENKSMNLTIFNVTNSLIEEIKCKYLSINEEDLDLIIDNNFIFECNSTIDLDEGDYSINYSIYNSTNISQIYETSNLIISQTLKIDRSIPIITESPINKYQLKNTEFFFRFNISDNYGYKESKLNFTLLNNNCKNLSSIIAENSIYKIKLICTDGKIGENDIKIESYDYSGNYVEQSFDLNVDDFRVNQQLKIDQDDVYIDGNTIYMQDYGELNFSFIFNHSHNFKIKSLKCIDVLDSQTKENKSLELTKSINFSKLITEEKKINYYCEVYDENNNYYDFDLIYNVNLLGVYVLSLQEKDLFLNKEYVFDLYTKNIINKENSKFQLFYLNNFIKNFTLKSQKNTNELTYNISITKEDLGDYGYILDGFSSSDLPQFKIKSKINFIDNSINELNILKYVDWDFTKTNGINEEENEDEDIIINTSNFNLLNHTYCDSELNCENKKVYLDLIENDLYVLDKENRNEIDMYFYKNETNSGTYVFLKNKDLENKPIDLTNEKKCSYEELYDGLNNNEKYSNYLIYKTNCNPQIYFNDENFENINYMDDIYYLKINSANLVNNEILTINIDDLIITKKITPKEISSDYEKLYLSNINSDLLKEIDYFDLFFFDNSLNNISENTTSKYKKIELNKSYDYKIIDSDNSLVEISENKENYNYYDLYKLNITYNSNDDSNVLYKCYLTFNNIVVDLDYGYKFGTKRKEVEFKHQLTNEEGLKEIKVYCNFLNSNINKEFTRDSIYVYNNKLNISNVELKNKEVMIDNSGYNFDYNLNDILYPSNININLESGYQKYNLTYENQEFVNQELIYENLDDIIVYNNGNNRILIYNPNAAKAVEYSLEDDLVLLKNISNKYYYINLKSNSIKSDINKNILSISYEYENELKTINKTFSKRDDIIFSNYQDIILYNNEDNQYFVAYDNPNDYSFSLSKEIDFITNCELSRHNNEYIINMSEDNCYLFSDEDDFSIVFVNKSELKEEIKLLLSKDSNPLTVINISDRIRFDNGNIFSQYVNSNNMYFLNLNNTEINIYNNKNNSQNENLFYLISQNILLDQDNCKNYNEDFFDYIGNEYNNNKYYRSYKDVSGYGNYKLYNSLGSINCVNSEKVYTMNYLKNDVNKYEIIDGYNNILLMNELELSQLNYNINSQEYDNLDINIYNYDLINSLGELDENKIKVIVSNEEINVNYSLDPVLQNNILIFNEEVVDIQIDISSILSKENMKIYGFDDNFFVFNDYSKYETFIVFNNNEKIIIEQDNEIYYSFDESFNLILNGEEKTLENNYNIKNDNGKIIIKKQSEDGLELLTILELSNDFINDKINILELSVLDKNLEINVEKINGNKIKKEIEMTKIKPFVNKDSDSDSDDEEENNNNNYIEYFVDSYNDNVIFGIFNQYENTDEIYLKDGIFSFYTDLKLKCDYTFKTNDEDLFFDFDSESTNYHVYDLSSKNNFYDTIEGVIQVDCKDELLNTLLQFEKDYLGNKNKEEIDFIETKATFTTNDFLLENTPSLIYYESSNNCVLNIDGNFLPKKTVQEFSEINRYNLENCKGENIKLYQKKINSNVIYFYDLSLFDLVENSREISIFSNEDLIPEIGINNIYTNDYYKCEVDDMLCAGERLIHQCNILNNEFNLKCYNEKGIVINENINLDDYKIKFIDNSEKDKNIYKVNLSCSLSNKELNPFLIINNSGNIERYENEDIFVFKNNSKIDFYCEYNNENLFVKSENLNLESSYKFLDLTSSILENSIYRENINYIYSNNVNLINGFDFYDGFKNKEKINGKWNYYLDLTGDNYNILNLNSTHKAIISKPHYNYDKVENKLYSQIIN